MTIDQTEKGFEKYIERYLLASGYSLGNPNNFNRELAIDVPVLVKFIQDTQPDKWEALQKIYKGDVEQGIARRIAQECDSRGLLDVLRKPVTDRGVKINLAFFKPASGLNPETLKLYSQNILTVTRQVHFSQKNEKSLDLVLSLNGLPVATAELKQPFTNQTVEDAKKQYKNDRDPRELLFQFKKRALVHFAVDPDLVFMTTKLDGDGTVFLPLNKGSQGGQGNPTNPEGYRTEYLFSEIWARESWLDILARFIHLQIDEKREGGKIKKKETMVFPRYHQLQVVRSLITATRAEGAGNNYLVQHSAGSGKSNSIAWLAHRLANLHGDNDKPVFDSVMVVTDRKVLDRQLQDNIYQMEHKQGVVLPIDKDSNQLADAMRSGTRIIISTLQKFSFILGKVSDFPERKYAVIVDEAHSSQTGRAAENLKRVLSAGTLEDAEKEEGSDGDEVEDEIAKIIAAKGRQPNISYYAFTATPKFKTLKLFGRDGPDGKPKPFHLYSMRQAIEERFILDVLKNYTTYKRYYNVAKRAQEDPEVDKKKASQAIAKYVSLHPHDLAQKTEIMIEHFRRFTRTKIGGAAKAMVVTRSRKHAVRYKQAFDKYIKDKGYADVATLVAFSGTVLDEGVEYTEPGMNSWQGKSIKETELPERFDSDDFQVLIVAEKYQTGFDQPLLHTMFVDKRLSGLQAVQTLSRLNRMYKGKEDTFILDFENDVDEIRESFKPYYESTEIGEDVDPNHLYTLKTKLEGYQIYWPQDVEEFAKVFFKPYEKQTERDKALLHSKLDPVVDRFRGHPEEQKEEFRADLATFTRLYSFLSQIIPFQDPDLEKLYAFARLLLTKLPKRNDEYNIEVDDEVALSYYRIDKTFEGSASLQVGEGVPVFGPTEVGTKQAKPDKAPLSEIIKKLNDRFGTDFTEEDRLLFDQVIGDLANDEELKQQAKSNSMEQFKYAFDPKAMEAFLKRMEKNDEISSEFMNNEEFRSVALEWMRLQFFQQMRAKAKQ